MGNGKTNSRAAFLVGEREGEEMAAGSFMGEMAHGDWEARVRVKAETFGAASSGKSAKGIFGVGEISEWSFGCLNKKSRG